MSSGGKAMKGEGMKLYRGYRYAFILSVVWLICFAVVAHAEDNKFKLKMGARGKICLNCHVNFQDKLKKPFVHTPVKSGDCTGCHSPHASSHGKMLSEEVSRICSTCHGKMVPEKAISAHKVVVEGGCVKCHDPHSANNKFNLLKAGNELCFGCHKDMAETVGKVKFRHFPVEKGCLTCHNPHASEKADFLLVDAVPALCLGCHKTTNPMFSKQHMNYPVATARCTTCHNPHGSNRGGILFDNVHMPVANRMCNQCHLDPTSATPFATKKPGYELCRMCHSNLVSDMLGKNMIHWPVVSQRGCLNCHNPHASPQPKLLKSPLIPLCGTCHNDTIQRQERSLTKHPPIQQGECTTCHNPHASNADFLFAQPTILKVCDTCHDWKNHAGHPLGEKARDPRNNNVTVTCESCHRAHGTPYKRFFILEPVDKICTGCHAQLER
jgi:DmsE family decaheme c-type cytochrome